MAFHYQNNQLFCEDRSLTDIAAQFDTPLYIYSQAVLDAQISRYLAAASAQPTPVAISYAVKANGNVHLLRHLGAAGFGADVTSGGELFLARAAGIAPERIYFAGVGKRARELQEGIDAGIGAFHVESIQEFDRLAALAAAQSRPVSVGVRVNPDIVAETHPHISTGRSAHKFGVPPATAVALLQQARSHPWLRPSGLAVHIGSQIQNIGAFEQAAGMLVELAVDLAATGLRLDYLDVGGGLAVDYAGLDGPDPRQYLDAVAGPIGAAGYPLIVEPGRSVIAPAGILLTRVEYTKQAGNKTFIITDAGMNDLIRPALYSAHHPIRPVEPRPGSIGPCDIVGPICETGDYLGRDRQLPPLQAGDLLAVMQAGAYGYAMSSNYNGRGRPGELLVAGETVRVIRAPETYQDLIARSPR